jgi:small-conductance mechanosensitive channel
MRRFLAPVVLVLAALLWIAGPVLQVTSTAAHAQEAPAPEFARWLSTVDRAEDTIARGQASDAAFETLRRELVDWRSQFQTGRSVNETRIRTVQAEIAALGPPPAEGVTEAPAVAQLRTTLNDRLEELLAPVLEADVAFNRADALIREIDQILRQRQATELIEREASPVWPATWRSAWRDVSRALASLRNEVRAVLTSPAQRARFD